MNEPTSIPVESVIQNEFSSFAKHIQQRYGVVIYDVNFEWYENNGLGSFRSTLKSIKIVSKSSF